MANNPSIAEMAERFKAIPTSTIYDTLEQMGHPNQCLSLHIRPLRPEMRIAGPAFTVRGGREPRNHHAEPEMMLAKFHDWGMYKAMYGGCVIVINAEAEQQCGHFGEMMSYTAKQYGAAGIVIDGGIRDGRGLLAIPEWPVFVRYLSPIDGAYRFSANDFQVPIAVTGTLTSQIRIDPGDWIVGDETSVLTLPQAIAQAVLANAEEMEQREQKTRAELAAGLPAAEVFARYHRL
jgi:regulator of RNase E activity RraA